MPANVQRNRMKASFESWVGFRRLSLGDRIVGEQNDGLASAVNEFGTRVDGSSERDTEELVGPASRK